MSWSDRLKYAAAAVTGVGAVVALVVSYRKQRDVEEGRFSARFAEACAQLGGEAPAVRIGGVYALAALADEQQDKARRQQCIDTLCGYLRLPYDPDSGGEHTTGRVIETTDGDTKTTVTSSYRSADREVRLTIISVIRQHLLDPSAPSSWCRYDLDFTGATFDGGSFRYATFNGKHVSFRNATFASGDVDLFGARFAGGIVTFVGARFTSGRVLFAESAFTCRSLTFVTAGFTGGIVDFGGATFTNVRLLLSAARFTAGHVAFQDARFTGCDVGLRGALVDGATVDFRGARFIGDCRVDWNGFERSADGDLAPLSRQSNMFTGAVFESEPVDCSGPTGFLEASAPRSVAAPQRRRASHRPERSD